MSCVCPSVGKRVTTVARERDAISSALVKKVCTSNVMWLELQHTHTLTQTHVHAHTNTQSHTNALFMLTFMQTHHTPTWLRRRLRRVARCVGVNHTCGPLCLNGLLLPGKHCGQCVNVGAGVWGGVDVMSCRKMRGKILMATNLGQQRYFFFLQKHARTPGVRFFI